jgi:hypothetical protein
LEVRVVPAATFTYFDLDGDKVTITTSKGADADLAAPGVLNFDTGDPNINRQLRLIDLSLNPVFAGTNLSITAKRDPVRGGDGLVAVGRIDAADEGGDAGDIALDLGVVTIEGDLGNIDCGTNTAGVPALKEALSVRSMGVYGTVTQGGGDLVSSIVGPLGKLTVTGDIREAYVNVQGGATASIGAVTVGGSIIGGTDNSSGAIYAPGNVGPIKVKGDIVGGDGSFSGSLGAGASVGSVTVRGSLLGGGGPNSGSIYSGFEAAGTLGAVKIGQNVQGGGGMKSGSIDSRSGNLASASLAGSLLGGRGDNSGEIRSAGDMGAVKIGHDVKGGAGVFAGRIFSNAALASLTIGGSLLGGAGSHSDDGGDDDGQVFSREDMGPVKIGNDALGQAAYTGTVKTLGKLASVTIGGSFAGGGAFRSGSLESAGDMGAVRIGHDLTGGAESTSGFIDSGGKLASVTIGGSLVAISNAGGAAIHSDGDMGTVKIAHDVRGGSGPSSGRIDSLGKLASVSIGGSLIGGSASSSGLIQSSGDMGAVKIRRDVIGSTETDSGLIKSLGKLASVKIGGSLVGSTGANSGAILITGDIGAVTIGHDLVGASIPASAVGVAVSGAVISTSGRIASVSIGGSVLAGRDDSDVGTLANNATIRAHFDIGSIAVKGSVVGTVGDAGDKTPVVFSAGGQAAPTATTDLAIGRLSIGGRAERMNVLAGHQVSGEPSNGNAQIGTVTVGGDWLASNLVAGVENYGANGKDDAPGGDDDINFGDGRDHIIDNLSDSIAKISSITIKGGIAGAFSLDERFGIVSHAVGSLRINGISIPIVPFAPLGLFQGVTLDLV